MVPGLALGTRIVALNGSYAEIRNGSATLFFRSWWGWSHTGVWPNIERHAKPQHRYKINNELGL